MQFYRNILLLFLCVGTSPLTAQDDYKKVGYASYYHDKFEGRRTSSGEKFRQRKMTCAHRTLPFGTMLRVTNLANDKTVMVTVNDRGPYAKKRIIDLSKTAARRLDFIKNGITKVEIEVISDTTEVSPAKSSKPFTTIDSENLRVNGFSIQVGNFLNKENMERLIERMKRELDKPVYVSIKNETGKQHYHVMVGFFDNRGEAFGYLDKIIAYYPGAFIVALKPKTD